MREKPEDSHSFVLWCIIVLSLTKEPTLWQNFLWQSNPIQFWSDLLSLEAGRTALMWSTDPFRKQKHLKTHYYKTSINPENIVSCADSSIQNPQHKACTQGGAVCVSHDLELQTLNPICLFAEPSSANTRNTQSSFIWTAVEISITSHHSQNFCNKKWHRKHTQKTLEKKLETYKNQMFF
jgi:hypothetical protein